MMFLASRNFAAIIELSLLLQLQNQLKRIVLFHGGYKIVGVGIGVNITSEHTGLIKVCVKQTLHAFSEMKNVPVLHLNVNEFFLRGILIDVNSCNVGDLYE